MRVFLVRHGEAEISDVDPQRKLTDKGRAEVQNVANLLGTMDLNIKSIWHSQEKRAQEAAEIIDGSVKSSRGPSQKKGLGPQAAPGPVKDVLEKYEDDLMIVGHLPFLDRLAGTLIMAAAHREQSEQAHQPGGFWGALANLAGGLHQACLKKAGGDGSSEPAPPEVISFRHGATLCLERRHGGVWKVSWMLLPDVPNISRAAAGLAPHNEGNAEEGSEQKAPTFEPPLPPGAEQAEQRGPIPPGGSVYNR